MYLDNATSRRDFRVQLRGNRSVVLFGVYLFVLIGAAYIVYSSTVNSGPTHIVEAQQKLKSFYSSILALLGGLVSIIAPALTATTVVVERQRRSFDLIFSAPVSPRYFLVGKMIASFRYTWMLLVLSLPVTATCIVLGGASWNDVLNSYILLSLQGLILTSIGLLLSAWATRSVSAVIWSYAASILYLVITAYMIAAVLARSFSGTVPSEVSFLSCLNPFLTQSVADSHTTIGSWPVPNWILVAGVAVLTCKICLLGAGTTMSPRPEFESRDLRLHGLAYVFLLTSYISWGGFVSGVPGLSVTPSGCLLAFSLPIFLFIPFLSTFGVDTEHRYWPNGIFSLRHVLDGRPSGGLPYILMFHVAISGGLAAGTWFGHGSLLPFSLLGWFLFDFGFWTLFWGIGQFASSLFVGLKAARGVVLAALAFLVFLPIPFLSMISSMLYIVSDDQTFWKFYCLFPITRPAAEGNRLCIPYGLGYLVVGLVLGSLAHRRSEKKMTLLRAKYE